MTRAKVYLMVQAALCVLLVILLSVAAVGVYREGVARRAEDPRESVYTREIAVEKLASVAPLGLIAIGMMVAGLLLGIRDEDAERPVRDVELTRDMTVARVALPSEAMKRERVAQKRLLFTGWGVFAACMAPVALYLFNADHFPPEDLEGMFYALLRVLVPCSAAGIGALAVTAVLREKHCLLEIEASKAQLAREKADGAGPATGRTIKRRNPGVLRAVVIIAAIAFIVLGAFNQSARDVLYKAITICTECVGLG